MKFVFMVTILFLSGCGGMASQKKVVIKQVNKVKNVQFDRYHKIRPGEVLRIHIPFPKNSNAGVLYCRQKKIMYHSFKDYNEAFISESYFTDMKPFNCFYGDENAGNKEYLIKVEVEKKVFPSERLHVDKKRISLNKKDLARVRREQRVLNKLYSTPYPTPIYDNGFQIPLKSKITSIYGTKRVYNNHKRSQHLGTDFRAAVGEPIRSTNSGRVVLARDLFYTGYTVIIDHGLGIFTVYGHLSQLKTTEGERIPKMGLIGLAGATGRVTGPHLHWGVKIHGNWVEGQSLVEATKR